MNLQGRVALITGTGSGIGKAAAKLLGNHGVRVAALNNQEEKLEKTVEEIRQQGHETLPLVADISKPREVQTAVEQIIAKWGRLDIVFANAGINGVWAPIEELEPEEWDRTLNVNLKGTFLTVKYSFPYLKKQGGSVIITSSINGTRVFSNTGATAYSCSKGGQAVFAKMVALEFAQFRVRVNVICPGSISTDISQSTEQRDLKEIKPKVEYPEGSVPLTKGQPGTADQVAQLVLFLASDESSHISGTEIFIDGTQSLLMG